MNILNETVIEKAPYTQLILSDTCPMHSHTFFEFSICLKGRYKNVVNGVTPLQWRKQQSTTPASP